MTPFSILILHRTTYPHIVFNIMPASYILGCHDILFQSLHKGESKMILIYTYLHISSTWIADINRHQILPISENCNCSHGNKIQASIWIWNSKWMIIKRRLVLTNSLIQLCVPASISNSLSYRPRLSRRWKWSCKDICIYGWAIWGGGKEDAQIFITLQ